MTSRLSSFGVDSGLKKPPPIQLSQSETPARSRQQAVAYPSTPILKGRDAVTNAFSSFGTALVAGGMVVLGVTAIADPARAAATHGLIYTPAISAAVRTIGIRNVSMGFATFGMHVTQRAALRIWLPCVMITNIGDALVVASSLPGGAPVVSPATAMHRAAAFCVLLLAIAVHLDPLLPRPVLVQGRAVESV